MKRTFIAVKIPVSKSTAGMIQEIKDELQNEKIKWVDFFNMHITLFFLGDTREEMIEKIISELEHVFIDKKKFVLKGKGVGVFKNWKNPRVVWLGIERSQYLQDLKNEIDQWMQNMGFPIEERAFKPHLTLGRVKSVINKDKLRMVVERYKDVEFQDFMVGKVVFYESRLTQAGPVYKVIKQFPLN
ncbi:MAG: RNA 2',3'-cyclic phosphodiesterase [Bacteroidales bacterium]|jgi:2'-5' RNA ligase|nr:RNA 2',3'-cyclic phosphodiesterase [Bacteroidales bacterium]